MAMATDSGQTILYRSLSFLSRLVHLVSVSWQRLIPWHSRCHPSSHSLVSFVLVPDPRLLSLSRFHLILVSHAHVSFLSRYPVLFPSPAHLIPLFRVGHRFGPTRGVRCLRLTPTRKPCTLPRRFAVLRGARPTGP